LTQGLDSAAKSRLEANLTAHQSEKSREQDRIGQAYMAEVLFAQQFAASVEKILLDKSFIAKSLEELRPSRARTGIRSPTRPRIGRERRAA